MAMLNSALFFALGIVVVFCGEPEVSCPAPRSPEHGQAFLYQEGKVVKYVCEPGYVLQGQEIVRCVDGRWEEQSSCVDINDIDAEAGINVPKNPSPLVPPSRPLFNWGGDSVEDGEGDINGTSDEMPLSDEARLRIVYPRRRVFRTRVARLNSATELEEEERKRSEEKDKKGGSTTTIHLQAPPSAVYIRRTLGSGKSDSQENTLNQQYRTASVHLTVDKPEDKEEVQVVALPRAAVAQNDKGEDALRQSYWMAQHYYYPRQASSIVEYSDAVDPYVMTLSESQLAWINSLHPELRDQYLRDLYGVRADQAVEGVRAQAFLRRYADAYNVYHPYYYRQPLSIVSHDVTSAYDYSCNQAGSHFVTAPKLRNAHIARYDRRQNPNSPHNHYLAAIYRCNPGYVMLDTRFTELFCSRRSWIGTEPVCVPARA